MPDTDLMQLVRQRLQALQPLSIELQDDSHRHAGHASAQGGGHLRLRIVSAQFSGQAKLSRHRLVYGLLHDLMPHTLHALTMQAISPEECSETNTPSA